MNKNILNISLIILLFSMGIFISSCKDDDNKDPIPNDTSGNNVVTTEIMDYKQPKDLDYIKKGEDVINDIFYPIGNSSNGIFAYITEPADEATGYYQYSFIIMDVKTNKILWSKKVDYNDAIEQGSIKETWKTNYESFKEKLNEYKINQVKKYKIQKFPTADNKNTDLHFNIKYEEDTYGYGFDVVSKVSARIKNSEGVNKIIYEETYPESMILNVTSPGYIKLLNTNYIICIIKTEQRGFEGPPHVILLNLVGTSIE